MDNKIKPSKRRRGWKALLIIVAQQYLLCLGLIFIVDPILSHFFGNDLVMVIVASLMLGVALGFFVNLVVSCYLLNEEDKKELFNIK